MWRKSGSIFTSILLVKVVWGKISGHTWRRASVPTSHCVERVRVCAVRTPTPFSVVGTRRTYVPIAHRKCYFVQWGGNIYTSVVFGRVGGVSNVFVLFHYLLWKARLNFDCLEPKPRLVFYSRFIQYGFHCLLWRYENPFLHYMGVSSRRYFLSR